MPKLLESYGSQAHPSFKAHWKIVYHIFKFIKVNFPSIMSSTWYCIESLVYRRDLLYH